MQSTEGIFNRSEMLLGTDMMEHIANLRVIIFGVGGVGSWCAESLIRNGIHHLTIVDSDCVCASNVNRQLMATTKTIGQPKVEALQNRLRDINPEAEIIALQKVYNADNSNDFELPSYDYIIDAIDSLQEKMHLIIQATSLIGAEGSHVKQIFCSMGAALRIDPTKVKVAEFWKINGDALARAIRNKFKRNKQFPKRKFLCVFSEEVAMQNLSTADKFDDNTDGQSQTGKSRWDAKKAQINGSLSHITAIFGMTLAGLVMVDIRKRYMNE